MAFEWDALAARIVEFLRRDLRVSVADIGPDTVLVTAGLVDSVGLVRLATFIERETGLRIPDRDVHAEHFDTLRRLEGYLRRRAGS